MEWIKVTLGDILKQYRIKHLVQDDVVYKQVTISKTGKVSFRGEKLGVNIGRKRQFVIDLEKYPNTLIFIRQGVMDGGIGIAPKEVDKCIVTENMPMFEIKGIYHKYLETYLHSKFFKDEISKMVPVGSAQKALHERVLLKMELFIPKSIEEQKEIIQDFEIFNMKYLEILKENEKQQTYLTKLKEAILQEAVQGKLVKQNSNDEPASILLQKIKKEKEQLIKEKKIKKEKPLPEITQDEIPFQLPNSWKWVRLGNIVNIFSGNSFNSSDFNLKSGTKVIKITNVGVNEFIESEDYLPNNFIEKYDNFIVKENDILLALTRPYISAGLKVCLCSNNYNNSLLNQRVCCIKSIFGIDNYYLYYFLSSIYVLNNYKGRFEGKGLQPNLRLRDVTDIIFPLPPLEEQKRIVEKVDQLMVYCDSLEQEISKSKEQTEQLMQSVLKEAFEQKEEILVEN